MPICTTCTNYAPFIYTVYESAYNLRLEECPKCHAFVDPYVEHDSLTLLLDLILLKRGVYRHLLYNRGSEPRKATNDGKHTAPTSPQHGDREKVGATRLAFHFVTLLSEKVDLGLQTGSCPHISRCL